MPKDWSPPADMDEYLRASALCDVDSPAIKKAAAEIAKDADDEVAAAVAVFYFVRDEIEFALTPFGKKASVVLAERRGFCVSSATLQVALLRAVGIPARFHMAAAKKEVLKGLLPTAVYLALPPGISPHAWCEVYLNGRWLAAEAVYDRALYEGMLKKGIVAKQQIPTIDWDGKSDLLVQSQSFWIRKDFGHFAEPKLNPIMTLGSHLVPFPLLNRKLRVIRRG